MVFSCVYELVAPNQCAATVLSVEERDIFGFLSEVLGFQYIWPPGLACRMFG